MKPLLSEFIVWVEACHFRRSRYGSSFEAQAEPALVAKAEVALNWALYSRNAVELYTTTLEPKPLLASLILQRARVGFEAVVRGELEDSAFPRLTGWRIARSQFRLIPGDPPAAVAKSAFFGGPLFAVLHA
jgi:hypothetical protein